MKKDIIDFPADKLNLIYQEIEQLISTFFEARVSEETERYKKLLDTYTEYFKEYEKKIATAVNNDQLGQYFYENTKHRNQIFQLLETLFNL